MADFLQVASWVALSVLGLACGLLQRRGKDYFPANAFLGFAIGAQGVFYLGFLALFRGDVTALRAWASASRAGLWVYGISVGLVLWAIYLVARANRAKPGSAMDSAGGAHPPTREQIDEALAVLERGSHHEVMNAIQVSRARGWLALMHGRKAGGGD